VTTRFSFERLKLGVRIASSGRKERDSPGFFCLRILDRITGILEAVAASPEPQPPAAVARGLNLPLPTVSRLMRELANQRYLQLEERSNGYSLGSRPLGWGYAARPARLATSIVPEMERLRDATGETVSLHVRSDGLRVCIAEVQSLQSVRRVVPIGLIVPLHFGATGRTLLAFALPEFISSYIGKLSLGAKEKRDLMTELETVRRQGWAIAVDTWINGLSGLAAPVWDGNAVVASLVASGPSSRFTRKVMASHVGAITAAARRASAVLSGQAPQ
jgi:IclR family transcriptional regulator, KDG regulon repressor